MNKLTKSLLITLIFFIVCGLIAGGYYLLLESNEKDNELVLFGNVDVRQVDIAFRVPGLVSKLYYEEGDLVPKYSLLASLDKAPYDQQLKQAEAAAASIRFNLENAEKTLLRRQELIDTGGVSQEDLDNSLSSFEQLKASLAQAHASSAVSSDNLAFTKAYAPAEGIILTRIREPGSIVKEGDPVYTLSITSPVWIRAYVDEPNLGLISYGMEAEIYTDAIGGPIYTGHVGFISPVAEFTPKTVETTQLRTDLVYRLRIYADNPDKLLKQGMPVTVKLKVTRDEK